MVFAQNKLSEELRKDYKLEEIYDFACRKTLAAYKTHNPDDLVALADDDLSHITV